MTVRYYAPGEVHHVISRLVDRKFYMNLDDARTQYLRFLGTALARVDWQCLAYALMSNHIHLIMVAGESAPEAWFRRVHPPFTQWLNLRHGGLGVVFASRPSLRVIPAAEVAAKIAYVHNNPVRAKVVSAAVDSSWTSHRAYLGLDRPPSWLRVDEGLRRAGYSTPAEFDGWVRADTSTSAQVRAAELAARKAARLAHRRGALETCTPIGTSMIPLAARPYARVRCDPGEIVAVVCRLIDVSSDVIRSRARAGVDARRLVLVVGTTAGFSIAEVSAALGITRQAGSLLLRSPELVDRRIVTLAVELISTDDWARKLDRLDSEREQERGKIAGGRRRT